MGRVATVVVMAIGSIAMWLGVPLGLIYLVSQLTTTTAPTLGPYLLIGIGVPIGMTVIGKCLGALDRWYGRRTGTLEQRRQAAWLKSMRGERRTAQESRWNVLDAVMMWSVGLALLCLAVWFFGFAGSSIPGA